MNNIKNIIISYTNGIYVLGDDFYNSDGTEVRPFDPFAYKLIQALYEKGI